MKLTKGFVTRPQKVVIYGPEGIGKTTFAAAFPEPVFIDTEGSTYQLNVTRTPRPKSWTELLGIVKELADKNGTWKTIVLDTADWAEQLCVQEVLARYQKKGIEDFGYGKGYVYIQESFGNLLNALEECVEEGKNVVITAHAKMRKFEQPDEMGSYDRWEMKLSKQVAPIVKEWADMVLFANYKTYVVAADDSGKKHKAQGGKRVLYTTHHPCWDAKNRHNLPEEMPLSYDSIRFCIEIPEEYHGKAQPVDPAGALSAPPPQMAGSGAAKPEITVEMPVLETTMDEAEKQKGDGLPHQRAALVLGDTAPKTITSATEALPPEKPSSGPSGHLPPGEGLDGVPVKLRPMMEASGVSEEELRAVIAGKGYYPKDTPWSVMEKDGFIDGWVLPFWENIVAAVEEGKQQMSMDDDLPFK